MSKTFVWNLNFFYFYQSLTTDNRRVADFHLHLSGPALPCVKFVRHLCKTHMVCLKNAFTDQYAKQGMIDPDMVTERAGFESLRLSSRPLDDFHSMIMEKGSHLQNPREI